ncbi:MAG: hypothetical protein P1V36_13065, partial [Planctomycetota bacterium]|nr:hypothetical protein [Planctomycetota bacterium]
MALGAAAVLFLAGPGAGRLAGLGPRRKLIALGVVVLATGAIVIEARLAADAEEAAVRGRLATLATAAGRVATDSAPYLGSDLRAPRPLESLLRGSRVPARAGVTDAAPVALHPEGAYRTGAVPAYAIPLGRPQTFVLAGADDARFGLEFEIELATAVRRQSGARAIRFGEITLRAPGAVEERHPLVLGEAGEATEARRFARIRPEAVHAWQQIGFVPDPDAPAATLRAVRALQVGTGPPPPVPLLLTGTTRDGVPVLAHGRGPNQGRTLEPGQTLEAPLPPLGGADRLWLLLSPQRAFPQLLGDHVLARVRIRYAGGTEAAVRELRNGEDLTAGRLLPGIRRPTGALSREAFRWQDSTGFSHVQQAVPIPLDPGRVAASLTLENVGPGGTLRVVAATVARTGRADEASAIRVVSDGAGRDSLVLAPGQPDFAAHLTPLPRDVERVRVRADLGQDAWVDFVAPRPEAAAAADARARLAWIIGLAVALMLVVLLVVDAAGRLRYLTWRLATGVLVAALVPLATTIFLVDRENTERTEAEHTARVRDEVQRVEGRLDDALSRVRDAARRLARHLATEIEPGQYGEIHRVARLYGTAALDGGLTGTVAISGTDLPLLFVPLGRGTERPGLRAPRVLQGVGQQTGMHVSAWDGLLLVGTARRGRTDDWVRVTIGVRVEDAFLAAARQESAG